MFLECIASMDVSHCHCCPPLDACAPSVAPGWITFLVDQLLILLLEFSLYKSHWLAWYLGMQLLAAWLNGTTILSTLLFWTKKEIIFLFGCFFLFIIIIIYFPLFLRCGVWICCVSWWWCVSGSWILLHVI